MTFPLVLKTVPSNIYRYITSEIPHDEQKSLRFRGGSPRARLSLFFSCFFFHFLIFSLISIHHFVFVQRTSFRKSQLVTP